MKHIVIVSTSFPSSYNGSEAAGSFVADFSEELSKHVQVTVLAPSLESSKEIITSSLNIQRFQVPKLPLSLLKPYNPLHWPAIIKTLKIGMESLEQLASNHKINYIFALWALPSGYWAQKVGESYNIPYSIWALGSDIWGLGKVPVISYILKNVLKNSHYNFADGYLLKEAVENITGEPAYFLPSTRALNITEQKELSENPPYKLAFLGRWHPNKGIDILLESLSLLNKEDWKNIKEIKIAGGGNLEKEVKLACDNLKYQNLPVTQLGYLNKQQATELFLWADYVLIPSRIESIPVVFSDAMKCDCPVICMPVGDLPRLLKQCQVGILANEVSTLAFSKAIGLALQNKPQNYLQELDKTKKIFTLEEIVVTFLQKIMLKEL